MSVTVVTVALAPVSFHLSCHSALSGSARKFSNDEVSAKDSRCISVIPSADRTPNAIVPPYLDNSGMTPFSYCSNKLTSAAERSITTSFCTRYSCWVFPGGAHCPQKNHRLINAIPAIECPGHLAGTRISSSHSQSEARTIPGATDFRFVIFCSIFIWL